MTGLLVGFAVHGAINHLMLNIGRMLTPGASEMLEGFIQSLREQKDDLTSDIDLHNALIAERMSEKIDIVCESSCIRKYDSISIYYSPPATT